MGRAMKSTVLVSLFCIVASGVALAAERPSLVPPNGERASYLWTATRHSPSGTADSSAAVILRGSAPPGTMQVAVTVDGDDQLYVAKSLADGSLDFVATRHEQTVPQLIRLDQIARLAGGAGSSPKTGDAWKLDFAEPVPGGTIAVTVQARVTAVDGGAVQLEADGIGLGSIAVPEPEATPGGRPGAGPPGGAPGFPANAPSGITGTIDEGPQGAKDTTLSVKIHLHLTASFAGGTLVEARGSQVASPVDGPKESIETDWALTKS
jgi:hypothetical protein